VTEEATINLRIEGDEGTIFEGTVTTSGHNVTTASGGTHRCDGTNRKGITCPGPTCITGLDDGNKIGKYGFDG